MNLKIAGTVNDSIVDGPGIRFTIFTQGCPHHCDGCHNTQTHDFNGGEITDVESIIKKIGNNPLLDGVTFSGGEPFCQAEALYYLGNQIKNMGLNIITYTGYTYEYLIKNSTNKNYFRELIYVTNYLIDGKFEKDKQSYLLRFKGSSNQRIIDCNLSLKSGFVIEKQF